VDRGRDRKTWQECVAGDLKDLCLNKEMTKDQDLWRRRINGNRLTCVSREKWTLR
jgi:hypothetical protein